MNNKSIAGLASALLIVGLVFAGYGLRQRRAAAGELAALGQRRAALEAGIRQLEIRIAAGKRARGLPPASATPPAASAATAAGAGDPPLALLASNPKLMSAYLAYFRASLGQRFGAFYQEVGFSPSQIAQFEDLMAKRQEQVMDLRATALTQHLPTTDPSIAALGKEQSDQFHVDQTALLGPSGVQALQQFNRSQAAMAVAQGAATMALDSDPYTNAQTARLMQIVAAASPSFQQGGAIDPRTVDWNSALAQAEPVLSPTQLAAFKAQVQMIQVSVLMQSYFTPARK